MVRELLVDLVEEDKEDLVEQEIHHQFLLHKVIMEEVEEDFILEVVVEVPVLLENQSPRKVVLVE